jgi:hypothetical protein
MAGVDFAPTFIEYAREAERENPVLFHISADPLITQYARSNSAVLQDASADARGRPRRPRASP